MIRISKTCGKCSPGASVNPADALIQFEAIESELYRFPAIDPLSIRRAVDQLFGD